MKYEEIKVGDVFTYLNDKETVIYKNDEYKFITTIDSDGGSTAWTENDLHFLKPIKEELPKEGLLAHESGSLLYRLSDGSVYGFGFGMQSNYTFKKDWEFITKHWKPATPEQEKKFIEMLKKECESRGLFEDTKIEKHADGESCKINNGKWYIAEDSSMRIFNNNGVIFDLGIFATPLKESTLDQVTDAVKDIADFTIEESPTGLIILTPIKK